MSAGTVTFCRRGEADAGGTDALLCPAAVCPSMGADMVSMRIWLRRDEEWNCLARRNPGMGTADLMDSKTKLWCSQ
ncbi:hypothetical protein GCM10022270_23760 [Terriglobus aquaticus]